MVDISNGTRRVSYCLLSPSHSDDLVDALSDWLVGSVQPNSQAADHALPEKQRKIHIKSATAFTSSSPLAWIYLHSSIYHFMALGFFFLCLDLQAWKHAGPCSNLQAVLPDLRPSVMPSLHKNKQTSTRSSRAAS